MSLAGKLRAAYESCTLFGLPLAAPQWRRRWWWREEAEERVRPGTAGFEEEDERQGRSRKRNITPGGKIARERVREISAGAKRADVRGNL